MTQGQQWDALVEDWQRKNDAALAVVPPLDAGLVQSVGEDGFLGLVEQRNAARRRMDEFRASIA